MAPRSALPEPVIHVPLNHIARSPKWETEKAYEIWVEELPPGLKRSNVEFQLVPNCPITNIRSLPPSEQPTLDREGYQILHSPFAEFEKLGLSSIEHLDGDEGKRRAMRTYLASMTEKLRDHYDGVKAVCFDWRVRKYAGRAYDRTPTIPVAAVQNATPASGEVRERTITAAFNVHGDGSPNNFKRQLLYLLDPDEQRELAEKKYRLRLIKYADVSLLLPFCLFVAPPCLQAATQFGMWRPVVDVETGPMAFCDVRSVLEDDWEQVDKVFGDWVEESMYLKHNPAHKWYWLSNQTADEVIAFAIWDSEKPHDMSAGVAHSSFLLPPHLDGKVPRQSIEMRLLLWTEPSHSVK
ncbi:hypothetical protein B0T16DRAFT_174494 [Cercophora newfieldiana]|uniref:Uncharacterized protein n=1 Tax=Cercophora newfieldiana TaxID=92897 RepID=A0AA39XZ51_9PEZI|nr:hypothetical protein B0T16DRAFT_174494 [Cercophora newfieldiana]